MQKYNANSEKTSLSETCSHLDADESLNDVAIGFAMARTDRSF